MRQLVGSGGAVLVVEVMGAGNGVALCDLGVFVDQAAEPVAAPDAHICHFRRRMNPPCGRVLLQRPVRPMAVK